MMSNGKVVIAHKGSNSHRGMITTLKVVALVAVSWGLVYPALLWTLGRLVN